MRLHSIEHCLAEQANISPAVSYANATAPLEKSEEKFLDFSQWPCIELLTLLTSVLLCLGGFSFQSIRQFSGSSLTGNFQVNHVRF